MKTHRSIAAMALAATMLASSIMPAAAAVQPVQVDNDLHITDEDWVQEADGYQGKTSVTFEVVNEGGGGEGPGPGPGGDEDPTIFSAYVPTVLPILMDLDGNVVAPTNAKVINGVEDRAIQVEGMEATATGSMELVSMEEAAEAAPDEKVFGFSLAGEDMTGDMASLPIRIEAAGELDLDMQAEIPAQSEVRAESEIATVLFTLDWADGSGEDVSSSLTVDWENGLLIPGSNKEAVFKWSSTDSNDKLVSVESSNPEIADVADIMTLSAGEYTGQLPVTVNAKSRGTTTITGELQSGETASFKVEVSEYNASGEPSVDIDGELNEGDTLEPGDITVNVPIITPDGEEDTMPVTPDELPSTELKPGDNEIELEVDVNGQTITIIIHINIVSSNPSNGLTQSIQEAQAMGFTFSSYEDGLQIDSFENLQFKSEINVPEQIGDFKVLKIGTGVFKNQTNLKKITLPSTVTEIGESAFSDCTNLSEIVAPGEMVEIGNDAFDGCSILTTKIRTSENEPVSIAQSAFDDCSEITLYVGETLKPYTWSANSGVKHLYYRDESFIADKVFTDYKTAAYLASATQTADVFVYGLSDLVEIPKSSCNNGQVYQDDELNFIDYKTTYEGGLGEIKTPYYTNGAKIGSYVSGYDTKKCIRFYVGEGTYPVLYSDINYDSDTMYIKPASGSSDPVEIHMVGSYDAPERVDTFFANVIIETDDGHRYLNGYEISGYTIIDAPIQIDFAWGYNYEIRVANINTNEYSSDNIEVAWLANDDIMNTTSTNRFWMGNDVKYFTISGTPTNVVSSRGQFVVMYRDEANKVISYAKYLERGISYSYKNTVTTSTNTSYNYDPLP